MIKYVVIPEQKKVIALLQNTDFDAICKIRKNLCQSNIVVWDESKYKMKHFYRAVAKCHGEDVFDEERGKEIAKKKLLDKYYSDFDAKIDSVGNEIKNVLTNFYHKGS